MPVNDYSSMAGSTGGGKGLGTPVTEKDEPHDLELDNDIQRPHEEGYVDKKEIEISIEHKRKRVHIEAIHKAEKAKQ